MLKIEAVMNSSAGDVFAFKTCCGLNAWDQNLEIRLTNQGREPIVAPSRMELLGPWGARSVDNLMPHGDRTIAPGETAGFYCTMDPEQWKRATALVFFDVQGNRYLKELSHPAAT